MSDLQNHLKRFPAKIPDLRCSHLVGRLHRRQIDFQFRDYETRRRERKCWLSSGWILKRQRGDRSIDFIYLTRRVSRESRARRADIYRYRDY